MNKAHSLQVRPQRRPPRVLKPLGSLQDRVDPPSNPPPGGSYPGLAGETVTQTQRHGQQQEILTSPGSREPGNPVGRDGGRLVKGPASQTPNSRAEKNTAVLNGS